MQPAVVAEGLSKRYRLGGGAFHGASLYEVLSTRLGRLAGRRDGSAPARREEFWALDDVSFAVAPGEVVGIVGRNGAGKSTLLKILSRITAPTRGRVVVRGRLASLLEVGTGFHPELTGRENIFLNGIILGMRRAEIAGKLDEIVAFSELSEFLDTPVKRYSSGMYVRLAFAVAAHLEADILLVDEVLAVGDLAFQRKCMGQMRSAATGGRTIVFVSHNLGAVRSLCRQVLLLEHGRLTFQGETAEALQQYEAAATPAGEPLAANAFAGPLSRTIRFERLDLEQDGASAASLDPTKPVVVTVCGESERDFASLDVTVAVFRDGARLFSCHDGPAGTRLRRGRFVSTFRLPSHLLRPGRYTLGIGAGRPGSGEWVWAPDAVAIDVRAHWDAIAHSRDEGAVSVRYEGVREQ